MRSWFTGVLLTFSLWLPAQEFAHPSVLSFEDSVGPAKAGAHSRLYSSGLHFKHGTKSLAWQWNQEGAEFGIHQPVNYLFPYENNDDNAVSTFVFWVYLPESLGDAQLRFEFLKAGRVCSWFHYGLDFKGWSGAWVAFDRDMQGKPEKGMDQVKVKIEGAGNGVMYFDHVLLSSLQDIRHHTADVQAPFINKETNSHWLILLDSWQKEFDFPLPDRVNADTYQELATIEDRFLKLVKNGSKAKSTAELKKRFKAYRIRRDSTGRITGLPLFFERYGETYQKLGAPRYNELFAGPSGLSSANDLLYDLAIAWHNNTAAGVKQELAGMYVLLTRHLLDQGFRAGSAMGTLHHLGYAMRQYYPSMLLMKEVLAGAGLQHQVQQAMEWFAGTGEVKRAPEVKGMDVDAFNTSLSGRLASVLMMPDSPDKVRYLKALVRWVDNGLQYSDGTQGTFKVDGSMFHHRHNYPAYAVGGLTGAVNAAWVLSRTTFALAPEGHEILKQALLSMRFYSNLLTWPLSLSGRHPDGKGRIVPAHFARLALAGSPDGRDSIDHDLAAAYLRLAGGVGKNESNPFTDEKSVPEAHTLIAAGFRPEYPPQGNRVFPYSSLVVHRRDGWMATAMGHSRYLWATESYLGANHYGRYLNHGHLQLLTSGKPVSNAGSGFRQEGWDWNHFPGTTAAELPMHQLKADIRNVDENSGFEEMLLSDESFAGGASLEGTNGVYAMKLHEHDKYNGSLRARKSFFFFDNRIIALGSDIRSSLAEREVHTTLFQVDATLANVVPEIENKPIHPLPFQKTIKKRSAALSDGLGNYFFIRDAEIGFRRSVQHSLHEETDRPTQHPFTLAYINHGRQASLDDSYEYFIAVQPASKDVQTLHRDFNRSGLYRILAHDSLLHAVHDYASNTSAFVFFEAGKASGIVREVSHPCIVMVRDAGSNELVLSVADPDLRFYQGPADEEYDASGKRIERSVYSRSWINSPSGESCLTLVLKGRWKFSDSDYFSIEEQNDETTTVIVKTQHGLSREIRLSR